MENLTEHEKLLAEYLNGLPGNLPPRALEQFRLYCALLLERNEQINLTAITEDAEIYLKHFADSVAAAPYLPYGTQLLDMGSGAGFPGVPLKIVRPDIELTLADSLNKRVTFLKELCAAINIKADCLHTRAEDYKRRAAFDAVTARAVAALPTLAEYCLPFVKTGGLFLAYKTETARAETAAAARALKILGGAIENIYTPALYGGLNHIIIAVRKVTSTPPQYPRGGNKPRTQPL